MWTSLMEVVHRAGSAEAVRLALEKGEILARAAGFSDGRPAGPIKRHWWSEDAECRIDAASNRARFVFAQTEFSTYELLAFGIEILGAEALWPAKSTIPHAGGRDPDHDWEGAARYVDQVVADHGPLRRHKTGENAGQPVYQHAVNLIFGWFERKNEKKESVRPAKGKKKKKKKGGPMPTERTVQRWVANNPQRCWRWWG